MRALNSFVGFFGPSFFYCAGWAKLTTKDVNKMKWFKHYTDNYRGRSVHGLFDELGHIGPCSYYIILEICAEKLTKVKDKDLEESDFIFGFSSRFLRQNLRISQTKLELFLNISQTFGLFSYKKIENNIEIKMPIMLDLLDSDFKKTRSRRESDAFETPSDIDKEQKKIKNIKKELFDFELAYKKYLVPAKGQKAEKNFNAQIKTMMDYQQLLNSMVNYKKYLAIKENSWRRPKQTFAAYLGTKSSGYFWRDWIDWKPETSMPTKMASNKIKDEFTKDQEIAAANTSENGLENALDDARTKEIRERLLGHRKPKIDPVAAK
jgi:hypothetical protein